MKRKLLMVTAGLFICIFTMQTVFASPNQYCAKNDQRINSYNYLLCYQLMRDEEGNFLDQEAFEESLDKAIEDGAIALDDKVYYIEKYNYCIDNSNYFGRAFSGENRGGCCR